MLKCNYILTIRVSRVVVPGGAEGAMAPTDFDRSVNPISTGGGADYAHHITTGTPGFSDLPTALRWQDLCDVPAPSSGLVVPGQEYNSSPPAVQCSAR